MQQTEYYGRYEGEYAEFNNERGQKLRDNSDEQFADILARRVGRELQHDMLSFTRARLALAITSVGALVMLFGLLVLALILGVTKESEGASIALGWGFVAVCWVLVCVNFAFNKGSKQEKKVTNEKKFRSDLEETGAC